MVANSPIERVGPGQVDYLLNRLNDIERRLNEGGARSSYPFSVGHAGVRDFSIEPSASGDGTADIFVGDGAGGKLIQVKTDSIYHTKILMMLEQSGRLGMSTDALAGFGWGTPSYSLLYGGTEEANLAVNTNHANAVVIGTGLFYNYNPTAYFQPRVRARSATAQSITIYAQFRHFDGSTYDTAEVNYPLAGPVTVAKFPEFAAQWVPGDINGACAVFFKAFSPSGTPGDVNVQLFYQAGYGTSQRAYNDFGSTVLK